MTQKELYWLNEFLRRVVTRRDNEENELVNLVKTIENKMTRNEQLLV